MSSPLAPLRLVLVIFALCPLAARSSPATPGASAKVHDHAGYIFHVADGPHGPAERAIDATQTLTAAIDQDVPGAVQVVVQGDAADVRLADRLLFRVTAEDARAAGASSLAEYAPRLQTQLDTFLTKERKRAKLQHGVLATCLAVFFAVLLFVLLRAFFRATHGIEQRFDEGDAEIPPAVRPWIGGDRARSRAVLTFALAAARIAVSVGAAYLLLLAGLSLFETTRPFRDRLALWAASPFRTMAARLVHGLPNLVLLVVLLGVLRAGWQAMSVAFARLARNDGQQVLEPHQLVPYRLLARLALVTGALLLLPLGLGIEMGLFTTVGLVLLCVIGLASLPLLANVAVGVYALVTQQFPVGGCVALRLRNGRELAGEVISVDLSHVRIAAEHRGEVRIPHLVALWTAVDHLPSARAHAVEVLVPRSRLAPRPALAALTAAVEATARAHRLGTVPPVELLELAPEAARFCVHLPKGARALRSQLLIAFSEIAGPACAPEIELGPALSDEETIPMAAEGVS